MAKTFEFDNDLPPLPLPDLKDTLSTYLESLRPLVTSEKEFTEIEGIVREFENGIGQELHESLQQKAAAEKNWLEKWWLQYAYLQCRESLSFSTNFGGSWIPVGNPLHKIVQKHATTENLRSKSISCLMHQLFRYWALLRKQKPPPFKDGQGKNYAMEQVKYYFNSSRLPMPDVDKIDSYFKTEEEGECPNHAVVLYKGQFFSFVPFDCNGEALSPSAIQATIEEIVALCQNETEYALGTLTTAHRDLWSKHFARLTAEFPDQMKKISSAICFIILSDLEPQNESEQLKFTMFNDYQDLWADKSLSFVAFKNGAISSQSEHSALDGMVTVDVCSFCIKEFATMNMDFSKDSITEPIKFDKIEIEITDEMKKDIVQVKEELITKANDLSFELFEFKNFGKSKLKELRLHPDAFVQICLQVAAYRTHQKGLPTYETATTRQFYHGRTETVRSCTDEALKYAIALNNSDSHSKKELQTIFGNAILKHLSLMEKSKENRGCDRHLLGLQITAMESGMKELPSLFTHPSFKLSGGGGNFLLSTSLCGYSDITGGCVPMVYDGYGVFYGIPNNKILFWINTYKNSTFTNPIQLKDNLINVFKETVELFDNQCN